VTPETLAKLLDEQDLSDRTTERFFAILERQYGYTVFHTAEDGVVVLNGML